MRRVAGIDVGDPPLPEGEVETAAAVRVGGYGFSGESAPLTRFAPSGATPPLPLGEAGGAGE
jgi:hypothetical protein